jgi:hypothetical protein
MDHRPFETWLLDEEPLGPQQKRELQEHLAVCPACSAQADVDLALKSSRLAAPADGFSDRFRARLAARKQILRRRHLWGFGILVLTAIGILAYLTWPLLPQVTTSPVSLLDSWLLNMAALWISLQSIIEASSVLFRIVPGFLPSLLWSLILLAATCWSAVWILSLRKLTQRSQGVRR